MGAGLHNSHDVNTKSIWSICYGNDRKRPPYGADTSFLQRSGSFRGNLFRGCPGAAVARPLGRALLAVVRARTCGPRRSGCHRLHGGPVRGRLVLFLRLLSNGHPFVPFGARNWVDLSSQLPVLVAARFGLRDIGVLARIFTAALVLLPTCAWFVALWVQRRSSLFWLFALMWAGVYLTTGLFAVGEYNLTYAMVALSAALLLSERPYGAWRLMALTVLALSCFAPTSRCSFSAPPWRSSRWWCERGCLAGHATFWLDWRSCTSLREHGSPGS